MAPGYLMIGAGVTWMPKKWFTMTFTPATWRGTFVTSSRLSAEGAYGVDPGKRLLSEFGGNLKLEFNYEFLPNMTLYSRVDFYSNYLDKPQNVDVRWDTQINMKINKWFAANLNLNLIYDDDTKILQKDGRQGQLASSSRRRSASVFRRLSESGARGGVPFPGLGPGLSAG